MQKFANNRTLPDDVIEYIANKREWVRYYSIVVSLVNNPKCPMGEAVRFLNQLRANDLQRLARNKNVSSTLTRQATMLYRKKTSGK